MADVGILSIQGELYVVDYIITIIFMFGFTFHIELITLLQYVHQGYVWSCQFVCI